MAVTTFDFISTYFVCYLKNQYEWNCDSIEVPKKSPIKISEISKHLNVSNLFWFWLGLYHLDFFFFHFDALSRDKKA